MKQLTLHLADGQSISINAAQISNMQEIAHEDYEAKTHIYLNNGKDWCVVETTSEIDKMINAK